MPDFGSDDPSSNLGGGIRELRIHSSNPHHSPLSPEQCCIAPPRACRRALAGGGLVADDQTMPVESDRRTAGHEAPPLHAHTGMPIPAQRRVTSRHRPIHEMTAGDLQTGLHAPQSISSVRGGPNRQNHRHCPVMVPVRSCSLRSRTGTRHSRKRSTLRPGAEGSPAWCSSSGAPPASDAARE